MVSADLEFGSGNQPESIRSFLTKNINFPEGVSVEQVYEIEGGIGIRFQVIGNGNKRRFYVTLSSKRSPQNPQKKVIEKGDMLGKEFVIAEATPPIPPIENGGAGGGGGYSKLPEGPFGKILVSAIVEKNKQNPPAVIIAFVVEGEGNLKGRTIFYQISQDDFLGNLSLVGIAEYAGNDVFNKIQKAGIISWKDRQELANVITDSQAELKTVEKMPESSREKLLSAVERGDKKMKELVVNSVRQSHLSD